MCYALAVRARTWQNTKFGYPNFDIFENSCLFVKFSAQNFLFTLFSSIDFGWGIVCSLKRFFLSVSYHWFSSLPRSYCVHFKESFNFSASIDLPRQISIFDLFFAARVAESISRRVNFQRWFSLILMRSIDIGYPLYWRGDIWTGFSFILPPSRE